MRNTTKRELINKVRTKYSNLVFGVYKIFYVDTNNNVKDIDVLNKLTRRELEDLLINGNKKFLDWENAYVIISNQKVTNDGIVLNKHLVYSPDLRFVRI